MDKKTNIPFTTILKLFTISIISFYVSMSEAQTLNENWEKDLTLSLKTFKECKYQGEAINPCSSFHGEMLNTVYQVNDFYSEQLKRHLIIKEISKYLMDSEQWTLLGRGYEQQALTQAQEYANAKKAAIALYLGSDGLGHIALIVPGSVKPSGSWRLQIPNSASFLISDPEKSYVSKGLSYAFTKGHLKDVLIYGRSY